LVSLLVFFLIYFYLGAAGLGLYLFTCPKILRNRFLVLWLIPSYGAFSVVLISSYFFTYGKSVVNASVWAVLVSFIFFICSAISEGKRLWLRDVVVLLQVKRQWIGLVLIPILILLFFLSPIFDSTTPQTPLHVGPDPIGGVIGAEYLRRGGTKSELEDLIKLWTEKKDLRESLDSANYLINWTHVVQSDSLLLGRRWGVPFVTSALVKVTAQNHSFNVIYLGVLLFYLGIYYVSAWALSRIAGIRHLWVFLFALAIALNCNLLNLVLEGGYAQIFATPFFLMGWCLFFAIGKSSRLEFWRMSIFLGLASSFMLLTYSEMFYVLGFIIGVASIVRLVAMRGNVDDWGEAISSIRQFLVGLLILLILSFEYLVYSIRDLPIKAKYAAGGGWPQPLWAFPSEIMGFFNIYGLQQEPVANFFPASRSAIFLILSIGVSLGVLAIFAYRAFTSKRSSWLVWAIPLLFVFGILLKLLLGKQVNNYQYMKAYTYMIPIFWWSFWEACHSLGTRFRKWSFMALVTIVIWISFVGVRYQVGMFPWIMRTSSIHEALADTSKEEKLFDDLIFTAPHTSIEELIQDMLFGAYLDMNWGNNPHKASSINDRNFGPYLDRKITFLFYRSRVRCYECILRVPEFEKIISVGDFIIAKSTLRLRDGFDSNAGRIDQSFLMQPYMKALGH